MSFSHMDRSIGRTIKTGFVFYLTDGFGRDGYISYNNGGFWKDGLKMPSLTPKFGRPINKRFFSLNRQPAPFKYHSDGSGRDSYVVHDSGGLIRSFSPANRIGLGSYLRESRPHNGIKKIFLSKDEEKNEKLLYKIQKNVVGRLYDNYRKGTIKKLKVSPSMSNYNKFGLTHQQDTMLRSYSTKNMSKTSIGFFKRPDSMPTIRNVRLNLNIQYKRDKFKNKNKIL